MEEIDLEVDFLFDQATLSLVRSVGVFSERWYVSTYPEVSQSQNTLLEFMRSGWLAGRKPNEHFDPLWYLSTNDDVKQARKHPLVHYLLYGEREGRKPVPYFDPSWYRVNYRVAPEEFLLKSLLEEPRKLQYAEAKVSPVHRGRNKDHSSHQARWPWRLDAGLEPVGRIASEIPTCCHKSDCEAASRECKGTPPKLDTSYTTAFRPIRRSTEPCEHGRPCTGNI